jgi:CRISPR-associated protein Csb1
MELALLDAWEAERISLPVLSVDFAGHNLEKIPRITTLEMPHRIADAILRDSLLGGKKFRKSEVGKRLDDVDIKNATALFELCPTALIFGMWDSTGPKGGLGAKFARAVVSEIVGFHAQTGRRTSSRIDPLQVQKAAGPLYMAENKEGIHWTLDDQNAAKDSKGNPKKIGKEGAPSEANLGNITPTIADGGVTINHAVQTTILSLPALRRLRFPLSNQQRNTKVDVVARTALAALALCAAELARDAGYDLRSRCQLVPTRQVEWEFVGRPGEEPRKFEFSGDDSVNLFKEALEAALDAGLPWQKEELKLQPSSELVDLVQKSQELATQSMEEI